MQTTVDSRNGMPRNSAFSRNSDFPRCSDFLSLIDFLSNIINVPRNSDFLPADAHCLIWATKGSWRHQNLSRNVENWYWILTEHFYSTQQKLRPLCKLTWISPLEDQNSFTNNLISIHNRKSAQNHTDWNNLELILQKLTKEKYVYLAGQLFYHFIYV